MVRAWNSGVAEGMGGIVGGALQIAQAYDKWKIEDARIRNHYALAENKLAAEGNILNKKYEHDKKNMLTDIFLQSANVVHPAMSRNLVYKLYNRENKLEDVHMTVFYPGGKLKEYLKNYYKEFGYDLLEWDVLCTGIDSIHRHIRFQFIYELNHANETIKEMIRSRALMGVKVVE